MTKAIKAAKEENVITLQMLETVTQKIEQLSPSSIKHIIPHEHWLNELSKIDMINIDGSNYNKWYINN